MSNSFCASTSVTTLLEFECIGIPYQSYGNALRQNISLTELASAAGTSYRHMQRIMRQLCDSNILRKSKNGYQILDRSYILEKMPKNYMYS